MCLCCGDERRVVVMKEGLCCCLVIWSSLEKVFLPCFIASEWWYVNVTDPPRDWKYPIIILLIEGGELVSGVVYYTSLSI